MNTRLGLILACASVVLLAIGCAGDGPKGDAAPPIENITWTLVDVQGSPASAAAPATLRLSPAEKRASGSTGVNQFGGTYTLDGKSLRFGALMMTRRAGPPQLMKQETAFTGALSNTARWQSTKKNTLELLDAAGTTLARLVAEPPK